LRALLASFNPKYTFTMEGKSDPNKELKLVLLAEMIANHAHPSVVLDCDGLIVAVNKGNVEFLSIDQLHRLLRLRHAALHFSFSSLTLLL
jgi:hypothetical protein